ncbi:methyltransferase domain-containing protein [Streptoalloteichus hindustanus]|uniref:Protein-L-isoaspartate O-methyltransferase n=1 Tax=Streptoalloteichus hindustanus TaxID=2017 RepID=A0A1M5NAE3_STRHI|nr:methyltransferase domain-containing protein [Streptoalloteichus hindustanus]SHG86514.1 protein-L-isoaspartate(D-aspartate) O-methyltransferase [Streptoalloteichus hindustanus]
MAVTDQPESEWGAHLRSLVASLVEQGDLVSSPWRAAFAAIPRHVFVPRVLRQTPAGHQVLSADADRERWLSTVYSDESLVTQQRPHGAGYRLPSGEPVQVPTSSSTMPSLMARMLEALDVRGGHRVLEIGTGTGYNAALLSHRLGADNVVSIDIDPNLVTTARRHLGRLGLAPTLVVGDGAGGVPEHGPYDRIIATAAVPEIPVAWIEQLAPGGKILANVRGDLFGGTLCLLAKKDEDDEVVGPFLPLGGHFMWVRPHIEDPHRPHEIIPPGGRSEPARTTTSPDVARVAEIADDDGFRFLLQLQVSGARAFHRGTRSDRGTDREVFVISAADGSRAEAFIEPDHDKAHRVVQQGPRRLWDTVEATVRLWTHLGQPAPDRYGLVATDTTQFVWLDSDTGWYRWPLPLV